MKPGTRSFLFSCLSSAVPFVCPICGARSFDDSPGMFCASCLESLPFISPPYCPGCGGPMDGILDVCPKCLNQPPRPWNGAFALFDMTGDVREAIHLLKYKAIEAVGYRLEKQEAMPLTKFLRYGRPSLPMTASLPITPPDIS